MREDWIEIEFGKLCAFSQGIQVSIKEQYSEENEERVRFLRIIDFTQGNEPERYVKKIEGNHIVSKDDISMVRYGTVGFVCTGKAGAIANNLFRIIPNDGIQKKYLIHFLKSSVFRQYLNAKGATMQALSFALINPIQIPLAPLPIQRAIVSKIEALFSDLDNGIANFKKAQEQLKIYRQAVLKKAFEGGFSITNDENQSSDNLLKGWKWVKVSDVCDMKAGYFIKADEINSEFENGLFPCYGGNGLRGYVKSTTHEGLFPIVGRQGALCGNVHLVNGKFHATEHAVVVSAKKEIDIKCLYYKLTEMKINQYATGTAQPGLSVNKILPIEIIYPKSLQEQTQIVQEIESRLSVTDNLEFVIRNSIEKAEALRQSILKKAFEGKLLSQAEIELCKQAADYEPASELLKKITNEKLRITNEKQKKKPRNS